MTEHDTAGEAPAGGAAPDAAPSPTPSAAPDRQRDGTVAVIDDPARPAPEAEPDRARRLADDPAVDAGERDADADAAPAAPSLPGRIGRRVVARPVRWATAPWPTPRVVTTATAFVALAATTLVMMNVVHFNPLNGASDLIFDDNTPTGGDMGSHVWGPAFLRDHLLPNLQLSGWSMDWYAGMPTYRFYMVTPALAIVGLDTFLPYGVAFKLVAISGLVTLPFCCWAFGRLARFRYPMPELFAFAGMAFALQETYSIYGGNLQSTMAGEFSFSIALSLMVLGLGLLARSMENGKYRSWTAIVLALAVVSHGIVAIYTVLAAIVVVLVNIDSRRRFRHGLAIGAGVALLSAFWIGPFVGNHDFMTDMKYGFRPDGANDSFWDLFFPFTAPLNAVVTGFALVGFVASVARRHVHGTALGVTALLTVALVYATRDSLPIIGLLWNPRLLPLLYLVELLLMMVGIVEAAAVLTALVRNRSARRSMELWPSAATFGVAALSVALIFGFFYEVLPGGGRRTEHGQSVYAWGPLRKLAHPDDDEAYQKARGNGWASYNFKGYEGRPVYPEYHDVVQTMGRLGETNGCGRASWENSADNGQYGTTMALMLLPFWTDGCIGSMEGLFFEASGTTPYHFLTTAAMSKQSSNPVRELRYTNNDADVGVPHLQALGVRYVMVRTDEAKREAETSDELWLLESSGPWDIYEVAEHDIVVGLDAQPVVVEPRSGDRRERNLELGTSWFQHTDEWAAMPADDGPEEWQRIEAVVDDTRLIPDPDNCLPDASSTTTTVETCEPDTRGEQVDIVVPGETIEPVELPDVTVSNVEMAQQGLSFSVDQVGVPVLVKVSYFPNWSVEGAEGPYRIAPNFMVVVPTENDVSMSYDRSRSDLFFYLLTIAGIAMLIVFRVRGDAHLDVRRQTAADGGPDAWTATTPPMAAARARGGDRDLERAPPPSGDPVTDPPRDDGGSAPPSLPPAPGPAPPLP